MIPRFRAGPGCLPSPSIRPSREGIVTPYVVGIHEIERPEGFWPAADPWALLAAKMRLHRVYPLVNGAKAGCIWEGEYASAVADYVEALVGDFSDSEFYEVDALVAFGLPD